LTAPWSWFASPGVRCDRLHKGPHRRVRAARRRGAERSEAGDYGRDFFEGERYWIWRGVPWQSAAAVRTRYRLNRHARLSQPGEISFHGAQANPQLARQHGTGHRVLDRTKKLNEPLLSLDTSKGEVTVA
jgi:hypothetical protein